MPIIGVAVGIPEPHASHLQAARRAAGDPQADRIRTHVTLLPPTLVDRSEMDCVVAHLEDVAGRAARFEIGLERVGTFRPVSPVEFLEVGQGAAECAAMAAQIRTGPLARPLDFPYHPHVTIAQAVSEAALDDVGEALAGFHLRFEVGSFQLYEFEDGVWRVVGDYELGARRRGLTRSDAV